MNQENQTQEQIQALTVQALWVSQAISILMAVGMIAFFLAEVLRGGAEVFGKVVKK